MKESYLIEKEDLIKSISDLKIINNGDLKDIMHKCWLAAKRFYTGKSDIYFFDYYQSCNNKLKNEL